MTKELFQNKKVLVTGGAGFIGSNLVESLLNLGAIVRVLDNLETGNINNIQPFFSHPNFQFIEGSIVDVDTCLKATEGIDAISHQAALGSVPRSIAFPHNTHAANATGFLNMLHAAKENNVKRFVYASSSSVYGDSKASPKTIGSEGNLLSPYAVSKALNEEYANVYHRLHEMETVGLRYFNVFGPKQDPNGVYAAAIPKFIDKLRKGEELIINGDGQQTRDFTYVQNAVKANLLALSTNNKAVYGRAFNVACSRFQSLNQVIETLIKELKENQLLSANYTITNGPDRAGDIRDSLADISETEQQLNYTDIIQFEEGVKLLIASLD